MGLGLQAHRKPGGGLDGLGWAMGFPAGRRAGKPLRGLGGVCGLGFPQPGGDKD